MRDMARSFDSGEGSFKQPGTAILDADDSQFCSAAVTGEDVRIGWDWKCVNLLCCELRASSRALRCGEKKKSARPRTNHSERPGHVSAIHLNISFCAFDSGCGVGCSVWRPVVV